MFEWHVRETTPWSDTAAAAAAELRPIFRQYWFGFWFGVADSKKKQVTFGARRHSTDAGPK